MVLCPPFKWSLKRGFDLHKTPPPEESSDGRRPTIKFHTNDVVGVSNLGNDQLTGIPLPSHTNDITLDDGAVPIKPSSTSIQNINSGKKISYLSIQSTNSNKKSSYTSSQSTNSDKKISYASIESVNSSNGRDSDVETHETSENNVARPTIADIIYKDPNKIERRKRIALPPPIHVDVTDIQYNKYVKSAQSMEQIQAALLDNDFLRNLMVNEPLIMVTEAMNSQDYSPGSLIIREGESGSHLYVSAEGQFEVLKGGQVVKTFGPGVAFGELAILYRAKRFASIRCITPAKVWMLERRIFQKIMVRSGRQEQDDNIRFLSSVPLLKDIHQSNLPMISECLKREFFSAGMTVVRQGDRGDTFYIIRGGKVAVTKRDGDDEERQVARLGRGDYFGEQALLHAERRLATVTALPPGVECLTLDRRNFTKLLGGLPELKKEHHKPRTSGRRTSEIKSEYDFVELSDLKILGTLGVGGFGRVELVRYVPDPSLTFALKCLKKIEVVQLQQQENAYNEKHIMMDCSNSSFICQLYRTFKDSKYIYFLMEPILGGDVWTILQKRRHFSENIARFMMACVVEALQYLHSRDIIYRDLKPENLMMDKAGYIKLVDFGFAKRIPPNSKTWTFAGTPEYVAPEIVLNKGHDRAVDCWALGIFVHELVVGRPPFKAAGGDHMKTYTLILRGIDAVTFHPRVSNSTKLLHLIRKLCRPVPAERLGYLKNGMADIKNHRWYLGFDWQALGERKMKAPLILPIANNWDRTHFEPYPYPNKLPPDETSGWDIDF